MSKLEELIQELCPNGVEYKSLNNVCDKIYAGGTPSTSHEDYYDGEIPWIRSGEINFNSIYKAERNITELGLTNSSAKWIESKSVVMAMTGATVARSAVTEIDLTANQSVCALVPNRVKINYKFLYYCISNMYSLLKSKGQGALTSLNLQMIKEVRVPVPPLEVQSEIVRILDNFTLLTAELTAELTARKEQYGIYLNKIINADKFNKIKLEEVSMIFDGTHSTPEYKDEGIKFISVENIKNIYGTQKYISQEAYDKYKIKPLVGDVFMTRIGDVGTPAVMTKQEDLAYYVSLALIRPNEKLLPKYLYFYIQSSAFKKELNKYILHNAVPIKINKGDIGRCKIAVPTISEQQRIIDLLEKFDIYISDITQGLPAEIELRQKQYEYYRDKLLTFKELE